MKNNLKINITVTKIVVTKQGYYWVDWEARVDGKKKSGSKESSYSSQSASAIRGKLKRGYALEVALYDLLNL